MTDYRIRKRATTCMASGREFADGDVVVSTIYPDPEGGFERRDTLEEHFVRDGAFSYWRTVHRTEPEEDRRLDYDLALQFLDKLLAEAAAEQEGLAYALTLLLARKRRVKVKETRRLPEGELLLVLVPRAEDDELVQVRAPRLNDDAVERIQDQLARLFAFADEPPPATAEQA